MHRCYYLPRAARQLRAPKLLGAVDFTLTSWPRMLACVARIGL